MVDKLIMKRKKKKKEVKNNVYIYIAGHGTLGFELLYEYTKYGLQSYHYKNEALKNLKILRSFKG